jgi:TetR/AcrR family transcriptional regulator, transcriptional repressor of aconitase
MDADTERDAARRRVILDAARSCFLQFGYAKTSLDDIAKRANLSRPLIYRKYKNKEDLFGAVYDDFHEALYPHAREAIGGKGTKRDKLTKLAEILVIGPWSVMMNAPMAKEFYDACMLVIPEIHTKHERKMLELMRELVGSKETAEIFLLAIEGFFTDLPTVPVLRKRLAILIDRFTGA